MKGNDYETVDQDEKDKSVHSRFLSEDESTTGSEDAPVPRRRAVLPWIITTFALAAFSAMLMVLLFVTDQRASNSARIKGWATDFESAREAIEYEDVYFIGAPMFEENGKLFVPHTDSRFVGEPRPELDEAWANLSRVTYIRITEDEAKVTWPEDYQEYWSEERSGYVAGMEMFHTLHCLNRIRMMLFPEYYHFSGYEHFNDENHAIHRDHCLQQIRQYIMCSGDMTPLPTRYSEVTGRNYVYSDTTHTCRSFDTLKRWIDSRHHGEMMVQPYGKNGA